MPNRLFPADVLDQAQTASEEWKEIDPKLKIGSLTQADFATKLTERQAIGAQLDGLDTQMTDNRNKRDAADAELWDDIKKFRSVVKGNYGDESLQYEVAGGTRRSRRKKPVRRSKAPKPS